VVEKFFRWIPGHDERVERRSRLGYNTGIRKALDILLLGKLSKEYERGQRWGRQNVVLPLHNSLYDITHRGENE